MFFTGLFSSHIPYLILAAIYSVSFGIYSFYYISNKTSNKEQIDKTIEFSGNIQSKTADFLFRDHHSHNNKANKNFVSVAPPDHQIKHISLVIKRHFPKKAIKIGPPPEFILVSRPPPLS